MGLFGNSKEIENVYANGKKIDRVFANGKLIWESTIYVEKPTVAGAYTYNTAAQSAVITGYDEAAMTISGTLSATEAGTYHVYFTLNKGYAWKDESTAQLDCTWTIAKKAVSVPKLSATSFSWVEGNTHSVVVSGIDTTYISQSGNLSQTDTASNLNVANTVTWSLKNTKSVTWTDGTTGDKSASWKAVWTNGTSHYKNDLYNRGWNSGHVVVQPDTGNTLEETGNALLATLGTSSHSNHSWCLLNNYVGTEQVVGRTFHAIVKTANPSGYTAHGIKWGAFKIFDSGSPGWASMTGEACDSSEYTEITGVATASTVKNYPYVVLTASEYTSGKIYWKGGAMIQRIWVT